MVYLYPAIFCLRLSQAKERLAPATSALLVPGTEIAWRPAGSGVFKYGRVSSYRVNDSTVEIEVSPVNVAVVPVDAVRLIRWVWCTGWIFPMECFDPRG